MALRFLGVRGEAPPNIVVLLEKYEPLLFNTITPRCVWESAPILSAVLQGEDIQNHVAGCNEILLLAATVGLPADELIRQTETFDMAGAVVLDALASAAVEQVCDMAEAAIKEKHGKITARFSPGYGDFPLEAQRELLTFLNVKKKIGLYANESNLLIPRKSITAVIGVF
jgi:hypothetical protein